MLYEIKYIENRLVIGLNCKRWFKYVEKFICLFNFCKIVIYKYNLVFLYINLYVF